MSSPPPVLAGRYRLTALLARGGMADVHRAIDARLERDVAVKILREDGDRARFDGEVQTLAALHHPNLVRLLDAGTDEHQGRFLVLELREEPTLADRLRSGPLTTEQTARIATDVADALAYVHARGIVHRDVKPGNIFVTDDSHAQLADFGIAKVGDVALTSTGMTVGTAAYLAPEQVDGRAASSAVDVYALGLVMIECLTGRRAFDGPAGEVAVARLVRDPELPTNVPERWAALLCRMTARDPSTRPTAGDVAGELAALGATATAPVTLSPASTTAPLPVVGERRGSRRRRRTVALLGTAALAVAALTGSLVAAHGGDAPASPPPRTTRSSVTTTTTTSAPPPTTVQPVVVTTSPRRARPETKLPRGHDGSTHGRHGDGGGGD
ncbi:MAG TPA: serine/threonine-protein kinase [Acidimicrobiia bacterium]|nr:serine/threonine-protein kinase [Acidimicrobiia bacterium]